MKLFQGFLKMRLEDQILFLLFSLQSLTFIIFVVVKNALAYQDLLILGLLAVQLIGYYWMHRQKYRWLYLLLPLIEYALILIIFARTSTGVEGIVLVLFTMKIMMMYQVLYGLVISMFGYMGYVVIWDFANVPWFEILINGLSFSLLVLCILGLKLLLRQRELIIRLNRKILEQSSAMEKMAMIEERGRIAKDMHDTIGHTLTTAIVSLESADVLMDKDVNEAHRRMNIAKEQLKLGLGDVRQVVKKLSADTNPKYELPLAGLINQMLAQVRLNTAIDIVFQSTFKGVLLSLQNYVIYSVIKESVTNAMKHAVASRIEVTLGMKKDIVEVTILNDGVIATFFEVGYGLKTMKESVEAIGGRMTCGYKEINHFQVKVDIPVIKEMNNHD